MLWVKLPVVDRIQPQNNKFATGVENKGTGDSKLNDSPAFDFVVYNMIFINKLTYSTAQK